MAAAKATPLPPRLRSPIDCAALGIPDVFPQHEGQPEDMLDAELVSGGFVGYEPDKQLLRDSQVATACRSVDDVAEKVTRWMNRTLDRQRHKRRRLYAPRIEKVACKEVRRPAVR